MECFNYEGGMVHVGVYVLRHLKDLGWAIDKWLQVTNDTDYSCHTKLVKLV